jgi:hypothetical protein
MFAHSEVFQIEFLSKHVFFGLCKSILVNPLFFKEFSFVRSNWYDIQSGLVWKFDRQIN